MNRFAVCIPCCCNNVISHVYLSALQYVISEEANITVSLLCEFFNCSTIGVWPSPYISMSYVIVPASCYFRSTNFYYHQVYLPGRITAG